MSCIGKPDEEVNGHIVGTDYGQAWVTYQGRKQGETCYPHNEAEALAMCHSIIERIKSECGPVFKDIYPADAWMLHFDGV